MYNKEHYTTELTAIADQQLTRKLLAIETAPGRVIQIDGTEYLNFASNNYLSLANHNDIKNEIIATLNAKGNGATGSRLLGGNFIEHQQLENKLAHFKGVESALVFNSGYNANVGILTTFANAETHVFSDKLNHASIVDGIKLSGAKLHRYQHCDMEHLATLLKKYDGDKIIVTDAVFSMDGTCAPLESICELAERYEALIVVDEAHSEGVFGTDGKGLVDALHLTDRVDLCMGTFGKAYGCFGAFVSGKKILIDYLIQKCRSFTYTTALPAFMMRAISAAIDAAIAEPWRRESLIENSALLRVALTEKGFDIGNSVSQIIPIILGDNETAIHTSKELETLGIWVPAIREPTVPKGSARLRINLNAEHTSKDIALLLESLCNTTWYKKNGTN